MLVGGGSVRSGGLDIANLMKPALARGHVQCIGATTLLEHRKYFERDAAMERRFQPVMVREPSQQEALVILEGLKVMSCQLHQQLLLLAVKMPCPRAFRCPCKHHTQSQGDGPSFPPDIGSMFAMHCSFHLTSCCRMSNYLLAQRDKLRCQLSSGMGCYTGREGYCQTIILSSHACLMADCMQVSQ